MSNIEGKKVIAFLKVNAVKHSLELTLEVNF